MWMWKRPAPCERRPQRRGSERLTLAALAGRRIHLVGLQGRVREARLRFAAGLGHLTGDGLGRQLHGHRSAVGVAASVHVKLLGETTARRGREAPSYCDQVLRTNAVPM